MTPKLGNRTAVYDIADQIAAALPPGTKRRFWRVLTGANPDFVSTRLRQNLGALAHRLMSRDYRHIPGDSWPRGKGRMLFVDAIFCAHTRIERDDIVLLHDLGPITNVEYYDEEAKASYDACYRRLQAARPHLVFVSEFTKREFLRVYPADYASLALIPLYQRIRPRTGEPLPREKLVLSVGILEPRKNHARAVEAFRRSGLAAQGYRMALAGTPRASAAAVAEAAGDDPSIDILGFVSDEELSDLYAKAQILLYPSLLEGFGVPALEAPQLGVLPVVSAGTVFEEVVGPDGIFVDPLSVEDIVEGLKKAAAMTASERDSVVAKICDYQRRFELESFHARWREQAYG
jgi:glycosyltransferase involved in cell wall biosynthesis